MSKQAYNGAYSRRYSNYTLGNDSDNVAANDTAVGASLVKVSWNGSQGRVTGTGNFQVETETPACEASAKVLNGNTVTLTATPNAGYHFEGWRGAPVEGYTGSVVNIRVSSNYNLTAVFAPNMPGDDVDLGGDHDHDDEKPNNGYQHKPQGGGSNGVLAFLGVYPMAGESNLRAFVRKYWWAILIVAFIAYKEWKGARQ